MIIMLFVTLKSIQDAVLRLKANDLISKNKFSRFIIDFIVLKKISLIKIK